MATKKKLSLVQLGNQNARGSKHSVEERKRQSERNSGANHYNWKGGITRGKHGGKEYKEWRLQIFGRDNYTCQICGKRGVYLEADHIKSWSEYPELRFRLDNGRTLCKDCHSKTDNYKGRCRGAKYDISKNNRNKQGNGNESKNTRSSRGDERKQNNLNPSVLDSLSSVGHDTDNNEHSE